MGWGGISLPIAFESVLGSCCHSCCKVTLLVGAGRRRSGGGAGAGGPRAAELARAVTRAWEPTWSKGTGVAGEGQRSTKIH